jgi:hypothetical protein
MIKENLKNYTREELEQLLINQLNSMEASNKYMEESDRQLLTLGIINTRFFKESMRRAWSSGRMFDMEMYKNRSVDTDISDIPNKALKFEEWWEINYK